MDNTAHRSLPQIAMPCVLPVPYVVNGIDISTEEHATHAAWRQTGSAFVRSALAATPTPPPLLHVVAVISNPVPFARRYALAREFMMRFAAAEAHHATLYVVELAYGSQPHVVTCAGNPRHLQLRTDTAPLWHKENMVNIGVRTLLPADWQAFAWVDADVDFECATWAADTQRLLGPAGPYDVVQLFSHAVDMNMAQDAMSVFSGFGFQHARGRTHVSGVPPINMWHPGFAWAMNRAAYEQLGGLFELSILGAGDNNMAMALVGCAARSLIANGLSDGYRSAVDALQERSAGLRLGYVPGVVRHYFHGHKAARKYLERWQLLVRHKYDPAVHVEHRPSDGLLVPTPACPPGLLADIVAYFAERNEDYGYGLVVPTAPTAVAPAVSIVTTPPAVLVATSPPPAISIVVTADPEVQPEPEEPAVFHSPVATPDHDDDTSMYTCWHERGSLFSAPR